MTRNYFAKINLNNIPSNKSGANGMRLFKFILLFTFSCVIGSHAYAYSISSGSKVETGKAIAVVNSYYQASQWEDLKAYASLFVFADEFEMSQRLQMADAVWQMYDLVDFKLTPQEASISPEGETAIVRYIVKTTLKNNQGQQKLTTNDMMCLLYLIDGQWLIADVNFAEAFMAGTDRMAITDGYDAIEKPSKGSIETSKNATPPSSSTSSAPTKKETAKRTPEKPGFIPFSDKPNKVKFLRPNNMNEVLKGEQYRFINNSGTAFITYEARPYKKDGGDYTDSLSMCQYLIAQMKEQFQAQLKGSIQEVSIGGLKGHKFHFTWKMEGSPLEQVEIVLNGADKLFTLGFLATPQAFHTHLSDYKHAQDSFEYSGKTPQGTSSKKKSGSEEKDTTLIAFPDRGAVTGILDKEPVAVVFNTEKTAKHIVQCNTMKEAPVILVMYDSAGKKVDTNFKNERLFKGFKEDLKAGNGYFFYVVPYDDKDIGKPFTVQVLTE